MNPSTTTQPARPEDLFLQDLKTQTAPMHQALEATPLSVSLMKPEVTASQYAQYLAAMRGVIDFTETKLFSSVKEVIHDIAERHKLAAIDSDLHDLNVLPSKDLAPFEPLSSPVSLPFALGFIYVVEGSTLGGRMILKHLQSRPFIHGEQASKFFTGYGAETGRYWKSFLQEFSTYAITHNVQQEIIEGAKEGFQSIQRHFAAITVQ